MIAAILIKNVFFAIMYTLLRVGSNPFFRPMPKQITTNKRSVALYVTSCIEVVGITLSREVVNSPRYKCENRYTIPATLRNFLRFYTQSKHNAS